MATNPIRKDDARMTEPTSERDSRISPSVSPEHREILATALSRRQLPSFNEILADIPEVGLDSDFERNRA